MRFRSARVRLEHEFAACDRSVRGKVCGAKLSVVASTLAGMAKLSTVPGWVRPPLRAVTRVEDFTLRLYGRTKSPEVLGSWICLSWLGADEGERTNAPFGRCLPTEVAAFRKLRIADRIAEGFRYPAASWWASFGIEPVDRLSVEQWDEQVYNLHDRAHAHGVRVALGWLLGELDLDEVGHMAPIHFEDGLRVDPAERELYANRLRELVMLPAVPESAPTR